MSNPLIDKFYELHPEKKEKPKLPRIEDYEGEKTIADELKELGGKFSEVQKRFISTTNASVTINPKPSKLTSYDPQSGEDSFLQIAEKVKNGEARVTSVSIARDIIGGTSVSFEIELWDD